MKRLLIALLLVLAGCAHGGPHVPAARIKVITLAVDDLDRALHFYRDGLGFETEGIIGKEFENGAVVFFKLPNGLILALWPATSLAHDAKVEVTTDRQGALSIGYIVPSTRGVDALIARAEEAGARITARPEKRFWGGYSGYFRDLDGHLWEVAWHPEWSVKD